MPQQRIAAAHYFSDCGMANFWSTFRPHRCRDELGSIVADGFSHIILIVPWAQFQPRIDNMEFDTHYMERLRFIMDTAHDLGLKVIFRTGYLWEFTPVQITTYARFANFFNMPQLPRAWENFHSTLHAQASAHPAFDFAFLTWEDIYWPLFRRLGGAPAGERLKQAAALGFVDFLKQRRTLEHLNHLYGTSYSDWDSVAIPRYNEGMMFEWAVFFEDILQERIVTGAAQAFPGIGFEGRIDNDIARLPNGARGYQWKLAPAAANRLLGYYHPNLGVLEQQSLSADSAVNQLLSATTRYAQLRGSQPRVFVDQFNFVTHNPEFAHFAAISDTELAHFLDRAGPILLNRTSGYGVWGYRDWPNDKIYNGAFGKGLDGWTISAEVTFLEEPVPQLKCRQGAEIVPKLFQATPGKAIVLLEAQAAAGTRIEFIADGTERHTSQLEGEFAGQISLPFQAQEELRLRVVHGDLTVQRLGLCSHIYSSGLYHRDMTERPAVQKIREINKLLRS